MKARAWADAALFCLAAIVEVAGLIALFAGLLGGRDELVGPGLVGVFLGYLCVGGWITAHQRWPS